MTPELQQLATERLFEVQQKHPEISCECATDCGFLLAISDFIFNASLRDGNVAQLLLSGGYKQDVRRLNLVEIEGFSQLDEPQALRLLRQHRQLVMVHLACRDFLKLQDIRQTMKQLSELADEFYIAAREWTVASLMPRWGRIVEQNKPVHLIALGMGKLGGFELNFSSDIDLIFCYQKSGYTQGGRKEIDAQSYFTKCAQKIIQLLDMVTADGRVFRVDMRLRPFGDSGPLVSSFDAIEDYYQDQGREWERYALLKARPLGLSPDAEESQQNQRLLAFLKPFVYRRYIDFSVIDSLRTMKRSIEQEVRRRNLTGNIKLGSGGIREAEFIVQAMQMLTGGKQVELQCTSLLKALSVLAELNILSESEQQQLQINYLLLRQIEQYLQAFDDQQTQTLPDDELCQQRLIVLSGHHSYKQFIDDLEIAHVAINSLFKEIIGEEPQNQSEVNELDWLQGFNMQTFSPEIELSPWQQSALELFEQFKSELIRSTSGVRGEEKLEQLLPLILIEAEKRQLAQDSLKRIFELIKRIGSRTTYLQLLVENKGARSQLVKLLASCQFIGMQISKFPLLLDQLIDPKLLYAPPPLTSYSDELRRNLLRVEPDDLELQMEVLRQFKLSSQLVVAASDVTSVINLMQVSDHLTQIAESCLEQVINIAWHQMVARYGYPEGATDDNKQFAVLGYGKLGGFELGYSSDLDVVFVHGCDSNKATSGNKVIESRQFYLKLAQRITHIFSARTLSGELYEIDTRLRPSGASGLLAININTFAEYQQTEAWTWEHQALVRSRLVVGDDLLSQKFFEIKKNILCQQRDLQQLQTDISDMRKKMASHLEKAHQGQFDIKQSRGGIADIEFISQYLVLGNAHQYPELCLYSDNVRILEQAQSYGLISDAQAATLTQAYIDYRHKYHLASLDMASTSIDTTLLAGHPQQVVAVWQQLGLD